MWLSLAVISAVFLGFYDVAKKHALRENSVLPVLFSATAIGSVFFTAILALNAVAPGLARSAGVETAALPALGHARIFAKAVLVGSSWTFAFFALKHLPVSIVAPIRSSAPAWTLLGAMVLFGERLTSLQWIGVGVVFGSYWTLARVGRQESIDFVRDRWNGFALAAPFTGAASALYDKFLLLRYPPFVLQCWFYFYLVVVLGAALWVGWYPRRTRYTPFRWRASIPAIGLLLAASDYVYFHAVAEPGAMISLISVVRRSSVVVAFLVGGVVFHERNKRKKAWAVAGILLGISLIAVSRLR